MLTAAILIGLSGWRIASLVSQERGPFDIFIAFRTALRFQHDADGHPNAYPSTVIHKMIACMWCLTLWTALAMYGLWCWEPRAVMVIAAAAIAIGAEKIVRFGD